MSQGHMHRTTTQPATDMHAGHKGPHGLMMVACCIPMLAIAVGLVVTGVASVSFLFFAVMCTIMMAMMMGNMGHGNGKR